MNMIRKIFALDRKIALCWNRYTPMITAKHSFLQGTTVFKNTPKHSSVSSDPDDAGYQKLELFLIGFASVFITFLWVGVFSAVLQSRSVRVPVTGNGVVAMATRSLADQVGMTANGFIDAGTMAKDAVIYQFTAIWESSCITQQTCTGGLQVVSQKASGAVAVFDNIATNSQLFVSVVRDVSSFSIEEMVIHIAQLFSPTRVYASGVLGEKIVQPEEILRKGVTKYYQYVDSMTFGAISAINPDLIGSSPNSAQN